MTILITGGASGIGAATARRMAGTRHVVIADRDGAGAVTLARQLEGGGAKATAVEVDVGSSASVAAMMQAIEGKVGTIDVLFNNAGISIRGPVEAIAEADWDRMTDTHVKGTFLVSRAVLPQMIERKRGAIINTSSDFAVVGHIGSGAYCAAKTAVWTLTKAMAIELSPLGIRVNAIGPGPIDTPLLRRGRSGAEAEAALAANRQRVPMKRLGRPEEVAALVDFLASEQASYIVGQLVHPNGGTVMW